MTKSNDFRALVWAAAAIGTGVSSASAQTAPEALAYLFFRVSVPPAVQSAYRTDIIHTSPKLIHFKKFYTGYDAKYNNEEDNIKIEQKSLCEYSVTGRYRWGDEYADLDTTLDFTNLSENGSEVIKDNHKVRGMTYYIKIAGVKACARGGSFRSKNPFHQFPESGQCSDHVFNYLTIDGPDLTRMGTALTYFKQTYCKGRAF